MYRPSVCVSGIVWYAMHDWKQNSVVPLHILTGQLAFSFRFVSVYGLSQIGVLPSSDAYGIWLGIPSM